MSAVVIPDWAADGKRVMVESYGYSGSGRNSLSEATVVRHTSTRIVVKVDGREKERIFYIPKYGSTWEELGRRDSWHSAPRLRNPEDPAIIRGIAREKVAGLQDQAKAAVIDLLDSGPVDLRHSWRGLDSTAVRELSNKLLDLSVQMATAERELAKCDGK